MIWGNGSAERGRKLKKEGLLRCCVQEVLVLGAFY
jgi:hypothetical protein